MTRKLILISIVLVGFVLTLGSNAWADRDRNGKRHHYDKRYHHSHKAHRGHHYGWAKGKRHHDKRCYRHHHAYRHRDQYRPVVVEKHIYHYDQAEETEPVAEENDGFKFAFSVADEVFGVSVEVSDTY